MTILDIKAEIWSFTGQDLDRIKAAVKACQPEENTVQYWQRVLLYLQSQPVRTKAKRKVKEPCWVYERYNKAYRDYQAKFPNWTKDGHTIPNPVYKDTSTANGLKAFIANYLKWSGWRATIVNVEGRLLENGKRMKSSTRKGTSDVTSTIKGSSVMWEVKIGKDKPSPAQLKEQQLERQAGGEYFFVRSAEDFLNQYDELINLASATL